MNKNLYLLLNSTDPADELLWLVFELQLAEFKGEKVHLLGHIPPGHVDCVRVWSANFHAIISRYADTVTGQFYGHTHTDSFQLFYQQTKDGMACNVAYIAPAVTPYHGVNPSYRIYSVSPDGEVTDHETYFLNLEEANKHPKKPPSWQLLYSAKAAYQLKDLSAASWNGLVNRLQTNGSLFDIFYNYYHSGSPVRPPCDPVCRHKLICGLVSARSHQTKETCKNIYIKRGGRRKGKTNEGNKWWRNLVNFFH